MRCSRVRRFLSEYPAFEFQLSTFNLPARDFPRPDPARNPFNLPHLQLFLDRDRNHVVTCYLILSNHSRRTAPQAAPFNRVSFLSPSSPHLCALCVLCGENSSSFRSSLIPRHSPLTTKSFTIRTSETPLPQPLYNPHLRAPLGSAGNKGLITPLESALTKNSPVTSLESALTETGGWGTSRLTTNHHPPSLTFATLAQDALSMTKTYLEAAIEIAQEAGKILIEEFSRPVDIRYKGDEVDLVTQADKRSEQAIVSRLTK